MCLNMRYITSRSKFISLNHRERFLQPCKCGYCAECLNEQHQEWYYRIYQEWLSTLEKGGYIFFDTLTYENAYLPHLSEFFDVEIPEKLDFPCFSFEDVRLWKSRFRRRLDYKGYNIADGVRMFICSEYGTSDVYNYKGFIRKATHRPHYHVLFFVTCDLPVRVLCDVVNDTWFFGRTDCLRMTGKKANYFKASSMQTDLAVSNYVAKYVQKVSLFQRTINKRIDSILRYLYSEKFAYIHATKVEHDYDDDLSKPVTIFAKTKVHEYEYKFSESEYLSWSRSEHGKKFKRDLLRLMCQFHRQSLGFGASALADMDLKQVMNDGFLLMPDKEKVLRKIPLPKYYERKLFEEQIVIDGHKFWQPTTLGRVYRAKKQHRVMRHLADKFSCLMDEYNYHPDVNPLSLARYVVYQKGRINGSKYIEPTISEKLQAPDLVYSYVTPSDKLQFHSAFISADYVGLSGNYYADALSNCIPVSSFIQNYVIRDDDVGCFGYDAVLDHLSSLMLQRNREKQKAFVLKQNLKNKFKYLKGEHI